MQPASEHHIPDGLLASMTLLSEKPRHGVASRKSALQSGIHEANSTAAIGLRFRCWEIASDPVDAPNNPKTKSQCLGQALSQDGNGVSLGLDIAGDLAAFIPGGGLVTTTSAALARTALGVQATLAVASTAHSLAVGSAPGAALGILGGQATFTAAAAEKLAVGFGKSIPVVGLFFNLGATAIDGIQTYQAYTACLNGHS